MPHGTPDWGLVGPKTTVYGLDDLGEHGVRLGSPHLWDRRGDALYLTDFREGMGMFHSGYYGTDGEVALVTGHSRQGAYSIRLRAPDEALEYAYLQLAFPYQHLSYAGLEFSFSVDEETLAIRGIIAWFDNVHENIGAVRYDHVNTELRYMSTAPMWNLLDADVALHECIRPENTMKLVVDMASEQYVRFMLNEAPYTVFPLPPYARLDGRSPYWYFEIRHYGVANQNPYIYIDNVIVTQNEP